jgi:hypothetical protein
MAPPITVATPITDPTMDTQLHTSMATVIAEGIHSIGSSVAAFDLAHQGDARGYGEPDCRPAPHTITITDADGLLNRFTSACRQC